MVITCLLLILKDKVDPKERRWELQRARRAAMTEKQRNEVNKKRREARHQENNESRLGIVYLKLYYNKSLTTLWDIN